MSALWTEMKEILEGYVRLLKATPDAPLTADCALFRRLQKFVKEATAEDHPAAGEVMHLAGGCYVTLRPLEAIRLLMQLKQRRTARDVGKQLVDEVEFALRPRSYPVRNMETKRLKGDLRKIAELAGFPSYSGFQVAAWQQILESLDVSETVLLTAPTGAGKTEAFMLPLVRAARDGHHFIVVYPRRELIKDQVYRLLKITAVANRDAGLGEDLVIGVQLGGIQHTLQDALWSDDETMLRVRCKDCDQYLRKLRNGSWACGCQGKYLPPYYWASTSWQYDFARKAWNFRKNFSSQRPGHLDHIESLIVEWPDVLTCPQCDDGTPLQADATEFLTRDGGGSGAGEDVGPVRFCCPDCGFEAPLSLSKEHHLRVRPHFLITNVESLDKLLLDPRYEEAGYFRDIDGVALDEVHVYHTLYGAHVHHLLRRLQRHRGSPCSLIGCSATIPEPGDFGQRLFGRPVRYLIEANSDEFDQESLSAEYFLFLRVPDSEAVAALSTLLQSVMVLGHAVLPAESQPTSGTQVMVFSDSLDVIIRAEHQLRDAESTGQLYNLRMEDGIDGAYPCEGLDEHRCPKLSDGSLCPTYLKGECWRLFWDGETRHEPLGITSVHAQLRNGMQAAREADVIISSPSLEVGVDLPTVGATVHYKTPRAVFSFIQRKGRAGRRPQQFPFTVAVLAGNDPMDAFHFQQFARLVSGKYQLPLNPDNPTIRAIHENYLDAVFAGPVVETYSDLVNLPLYRNYPQNALRPTGWTVVREKAQCPRWLDQVGLSLPGALERGNALEFATNTLHELIQTKQAEIDELAEQFGRQVEDRSVITQDLDQGMAELSARVAGPLRSEPKFSRLWSAALAQVHTLIQIVTEAPSLGVVREQVIDTLTELNSHLFHLRQWLMRQNGTVDARRVLGKLQESLDEIVNDIEGQGLLNAADRVSDLRYQIAALEKLHQAAKSKLKLPAEIVKRYQQAQFYLCWSCKDYQTCKLPEKMSYFIPETYFDSPANLIVDHLGGGTYEEAGYMLYSTYLPWKIFYRFGSDPITVRASSVPAGEDENGTPLTDVNLEGLQGIWDVFDGQPYFLPRKIQTVPITPIEIPQAGNRYRICPGCYNLALGAEARCQHCNSPTVVAAVYGSPIVKRRFVARQRLESFKRLSLCQLDGLTQVTGVDVSYRTPQMQQPELIRARYTQPLGYRYETRGLVLDLGDVLEEAWASYLNPESARQGVIRRAAEEARYFWNMAEPVRLEFDRTMLHTAAHMLLKTVSGMCGVNEESLEYAWNDEGQVAVWEKFTGGAGISDLFVTYLKSQASDVYHALKRSVSCAHCTREELDGCPDSIWISYCQAGRRDQAKAVSRSLGSLLLEVLTRRVSVKNGAKRETQSKYGLLVDYDEKTKVAVRFDI